MSSTTPQLSWLQALSKYFFDFLKENKNKYPYDIVDIIDCTKTGHKQAILRLEGHYTKTIYVSDLVLDDKLIQGLSPESVRALTYLFVIERVAPEYHIIDLGLDTATEDYIVTIRSKNKKESSKQSVSIISENKELIKKFNSIDANRIGYIAGVKDTAAEYEVLKNINK